MTKFKCDLQNVEIKDVSKRKSKRGNSYLVLNCVYSDDEINFYYPDFDSDLDIEDLKGVHDLEVLVSISKYSSVQVVKVK